MTFKEKLTIQVEARSKEVETLRKALREAESKPEREAIMEALDNCIAELNDLKEMLADCDKPADDVNNGERKLHGITGVRHAKGFDSLTGGQPQMENFFDSAEVRSLQKFCVHGPKGLTAEETRSLNVNGSAAVIPVAINDKLINSSKYSDLIYRAQTIDSPGAGKIYIPVASANNAEWHTENASLTEASPTLTKIELGGYELARYMRISAATERLSTPKFVEMLLTLLGSEVNEAIENAAINGTGSGQPKGLKNLTWTSANSVTVAATASITPVNIATALSKLPQKYARGAIILGNAATVYALATYEDSNGHPIFDTTGEMQRFLNKEVVISEHCENDVLYIVDPKELYIRYAMPLEVAADGGSGFLSASTDLRALTVVDAAWNPAACVKVAKAAANE